jgi:hypothetical protein
MKGTAFFLVVLMAAILFLLGEQQQVMTIVIRGLGPPKEDKRYEYFLAPN